MFDYGPSVLNLAGTPALNGEAVATVLDLSGNGRHLTTAIASDRPLYIKFAGRKFLLKGTALDKASIGYIVAMDLSGFVVDAHCAPDTWSPASPGAMAARWGGAGTLWTFYANTSGGLTFQWYGSSAITTAVSSSATMASAGFLAKQDGWVRAEYVPDTGAGQYRVKFFTSTDGSTWTQLGVDRTGASTPGFSASTLPIGIGSHSDSNSPLPGRHHRFRLFSGTVATPTLVIDWSAESGTHFQKTAIPCLVGATSLTTVPRILLIAKSVIQTSTDNRMAMASPLTLTDFATGFDGVYVSHAMISYGTSNTSGSQTPYVMNVLPAGPSYVTNNSGYRSATQAQMIAGTRIAIRMVSNVTTGTSNGAAITFSAFTAAAALGTIDRALGSGTNTLGPGFITRMGLWTTGTLPTNAAIDAWLAS